MRAEVERDPSEVDVTQAGQFRFDRREPARTPVVFCMPGLGLGDVVGELVEVLLGGIDFADGAGDVVAEAVDVVERGRLLVPAVAPKPGERAELCHAVVSCVETMLCPVKLFFGVANVMAGSVKLVVPIARGGGEDAFMLGPLGEEALDLACVVVGGEAVGGHSEEGVEDLAVGGAVLGEGAAVVDVAEAGDVPGVGGLAGAALAGVAGEALQGGGT